MKKNVWRLTILFVASLCLVLSACESEKPSSFITINGSNSAEHVFPGVFDSGKSGIDYKQTFKINSNVQWTISGKANWLNISPSSGSGEVELSIYPTSANTTDQPRTALITLSSSDASVSVNITQEPGKPVCYVLPANEVALYDRICWEYTATSNVNVFQWLLLAEDEYKRMTDLEILKELSEKDELKYVDEYLSVAGYDSHYNRIAPNSVYYLITIAYDREGNAGELKRTKITTPSYLDADYDAWVDFANIEANLLSGFQFDAIKEGYCNAYHLIYGIGEEVYNSAIYAFEINYFLKYNKKHWLAESWEMEIVANYPNNHTFTYSTSYLPYYPICFAYGWGVFKDGTKSSDLVGFQWDTSTENAMQKAPLYSDVAPKNFTISRSIETEKAKKNK